MISNSIRKYFQGSCIFTIVLLLCLPAGASDLTITYTYDAGGRLTRAAYSGGESIAYTYDATGNILTRVVAGGIPQTYTLTVEKSGNGTGTVTSDPSGISCGATCSATFNEGTGVTLTAAHGASSTFSGWSGGGCSGTETCAVTMDGAKTVTATFQLNPVPAGTAAIDARPDAMNTTAPWTLTGPNSYNQSGTGDLTLNNLTPGDYTLTWGDVSGWTKPSPAASTQTLAAEGTITFTGTYTQIPQMTGTVVINPEPAAMNTTALWMLAGPNSQSGKGDQTLSNFLVGDYMIIWGGVPGWIKPSPATETKALTSGGTITFSGTYVQQTIPVIQVTQSILNFGYVPPGSYKDLILVVKNTGGGTLTGTVSACPPFSIVSGGNYSLGAGESQQVIVRYTAPLQEGAQTCSFVFTGGGGITVQVKGTNQRVGLPWLLLLLGN